MHGLQGRDNNFYVSAFMSYYNQFTRQSVSQPTLTPTQSDNLNKRAQSFECISACIRHYYNTTQTAKCFLNLTIKYFSPRDLNQTRIRRRVCKRRKRMRNSSFPVKLEHLVCGRAPADCFHANYRSNSRAISHEKMGTCPTNS